MSSADLHPSTDSTSAGAPCVACRLPLPIEPAPVSEHGQYWHCSRCETRHHGMWLDDAPPEIAGNAYASEQKKEPVAPVEPTESEVEVTEQALPEHGPVICDHETEITRELDEAIAAGASLEVPKTGPSFQQSIQLHGVEHYDTDSRVQFFQDYTRLRGEVATLLEDLEQNDQLDTVGAERIVRALLDQVSEDIDLLVRQAINVPADSYHGKHSLHVAMLSVAMGTSMGWDKTALMELGVGCLLHDVGMSRVPEDIRESRHKLSPEEFSAIARHPLHTFEILEQYNQRLPALTRLVAYQIHERCNGQGYPRQRRGHEIHEAAKVAAVADVYVALVSPRPYRKAMMPHDAARHLLMGPSRGEFESEAVRALLQTISLYPIGSYFEMEDGRIGQVLRAHGEQYARPVVELRQPGALEQDSEVIDLTEHDNLMIRRPVAANDVDF